MTAVAGNGDPLGVRRVITGEDEAGRAIVAADDIAQPTQSPLPEGIRSTVLWVVDDFPPDPVQGGWRSGDGGETPAWQLGAIPPTGARWTRLEIAPGATGIGMHKTATVDLLEVRAGEIWLILDGGDEVHLVAGDCVVQRATVHRWENRGSVPCTLNVLMISTNGDAH